METAHRRVIDAATFAKTGDVFSPSAPIDRRELFAGRLNEITALSSAVTTKGQHAVLYGERGVGKTSLVSILGFLQFYKEPLVTVRTNCGSGDSLSTLWRRAFEQVRYEVSRPQIGFGNNTISELQSLGSSLTGVLSPDDVVDVLRRLDSRIIFIFDEFDQLIDRGVARGFAELIKTLSDFACKAKVVIVGVGDTIDRLIESHASIERAIRQVKMPRMQASELEQIIDTGLNELGMTCDKEARDRIVRLSQGLPHYVHLIGLYSARQAITHGRKRIGMDAVARGIPDSLGHASRSLLDAYTKAVSSAQEGSLYESVLLACAFAKTDGLGCFSPASVRGPLREITGNTLIETSAFASHLTKLRSPERGPVLARVGEMRRYRYRFINPLLQPYVIMHGISANRIRADVIDRLIGPEEQGT